MIETYWSLTEKERAALTHEEVTRYVDAELMTKGVLKVRPLVLQPEPVDSPPTVTLFQVEQEHGYGSFDALFTSAEAALSFIALGPRLKEHVYAAGVDTAKTPGSLIVKPVKVVAPDTLAAHASNLQRAKEVRADNERQQTEYDSAVRKQDKALEGLWADWYACRAKAERVSKLEATRAEYLTLAGDAEKAEAFLGKVFDVSAIAEAAAWADGVPFEGAPVAVTVSVDREIPF